MDFETIEEILKEKNVKYKIRPEEGYGLVEFWTDAAGQDIVAEFEFDGTPEGFVKKFAEYADNYDVDDQVRIFVGMLGERGVPNTVRELLDDCQEAKDTLMGVKEALETAQSDINKALQNYEESLSDTGVNIDKKG